MESAVRRVRASSRPEIVDAPTPPHPYRPPAPVIRRPDSWTDRWAAGDHDRWLRISVVVLAVMVVAAGLALIVSLAGDGGHIASPPPTIVTTAPPAHHGTGRGSGPGTTTGSTTTSTSVAATPGGPPVISVLSPSTGAAGQAITITGANFLSSDGHIVASFNGEAASTSCPAQNTCMVTVPPSNGSSTAQVIVTTAAGASNAVLFSYG
jgi:hypothetical protein